MAHIIIIVSNHGDLAGEPNGTYMPELTHAVAVFDKHGVTYDLASPAGGVAPGYGRDADELTTTMLADPAFSARLESTGRLAEVDPERYDGVYYPGGYGLLFDLIEDGESARICAALYERGCPVSAVCHGPAALSRVKLSDGTGLIAGKQVTGFTREEEVAMDTLDKIPFLLEQAMMESGATYRKVAAWQELVVTDGNLITGQNPPSAGAVGEALVARLV